MTNGKVDPIPKGCATVTPHLVVRGVEQAMAFYRQNERRFAP